MTSRKRTKIVCTLGPSTNTLEAIIALAEAGMDVCRLNFSHGTHEDHAKLITTIREARAKTGIPLAILQDLQGPKIRVGELPEGGVRLVAGKEVVFTVGEGKPPEKIPVSYAELPNDVQPGQVLLLDDGLMSAQVVGVKGKDVVAKVLQGGDLLSHKGMNLPNTKTSIPALTDKDREDLRFGVEHQVDWVALSFVRKPEDVELLRAALGELEDKESPRIKVMCKIEKPEALDHLPQIIEASDGIMVARGDLGIEMPPEKVPVIQKRIIEACLKAAKPVIVATQMLESMIHHPRATRAEVSDVAHAVMDHADATMLSAETASGEYPREAVKTMAATLLETEKSGYDDRDIEFDAKANTEGVMTNIASVLARAHGVKAILVASLTGQAAGLISRYRPAAPIYAAAVNERVQNQLQLSWGVTPLLVPVCKTTPELVDVSIKRLLADKRVKPGDEIVLVAGEPLGASGSVNMVELRKV